MMPTGIAIFFDEETRKKNDDARFMTERFSVKDCYWQTNVPWMVTLAHQYPLSGKLHPAWDERVLTTQGGQQIETNERVNDLLLNETQKLNLTFSSIYLIKAIK
ncbi:hypothetical protein ACI3E5_15335 [Candidatus Enterococcus avicola]